MMGKRALITGAAGFIGKNLTKLLLAKDYNVTAMGSGKSQEDELKKIGVNAHIAGPVTQTALMQLKDKPEYIFHCAGSGSVGFSIENPYVDFQSNVSSLAQLLEYVRTHCPESKVVYLSSGAVYGSSPKIPMMESDTPSPVSPYGYHKFIGETLCKSYSQQYGIQTLSLRLFSIYGEGLKKQLLWDACNKISNGKFDFFGTGNEIRDWLHVDDAINLIELAAENANDTSPVVNAGTGFKITIREVIETIIKNFNKDDKPSFLGKSRAGDPHHFLADIKIAQNFQWYPQIDVVQGIARYVNWFCSSQIK
ncbi:MAG: NAD-dependent epimerase/dehydratase family protein [Leptospirales bacterium]